MKQKGKKLFAMLLSVALVIQFSCPVVFAGAQPYEAPPESDPPAQETLSVEGNSDGQSLATAEEPTAPTPAPSTGEEPTAPTPTPTEAAEDALVCTCDVLCQSAEDGADCPLCSATQQGWYMDCQGEDLFAQSYDSSPMSGDIIISENTTWSESVSLSGNLVVNDGVVLTLGDGVCITAATTLTISGGGTIQRASNVETSASLLRCTAATVTLENITIDGNLVSTTESMIVVSGSTTQFIINNGTVIENALKSSTYGGALRITSGAVIMNGGTICNNSSSSRGGGVYIESTSASFTMYGGTILGNAVTSTSSYAGGGIYNRGYVTMYGGLISDNDGKSSGGAIYNTSYGTAYLYGGTIASTNQASRGNGVFHSAAMNDNAELYLASGMQINSDIFLYGATSTSAAKTILATSAFAYDITIVPQYYIEDTVVIEGSGYTLTEADIRKVSITPNNTQLWYTYLNADGQIALTVNKPDYLLEVVYVDPVNGSASGNGSAENPVNTIEKAKEYLAYDGTIVLVDTLTVTGDEVWELPSSTYGDASIEVNSSISDPVIYIEEGGSLYLGDITLTDTGTGTTILASDLDDYTQSNAANVSGVVRQENTIVANMVSGIDAAYPYTGAEITPAITVKESGTVLTEGKEYTVAYTENKNAGDASVTITAIAPYQGEVTLSFAITPLALRVSLASDLVITKVYDATTAVAVAEVANAFVVTGTVADETVTASATWVYDVADVTATTATAGSICFAYADGAVAGNYTWQETAFQCAASITPKPVAGGLVGDFTALTYNGTAQTPSATLTIDGLTATGGWSSVTNVSDTVTTFTADGNFSGSILDQAIGMAPATASLAWSVPSELNYDGSAKTLTATVENLLGSDTMADFTLVYNNESSAINAGSYTAAVTDLGNVNYALSTTAADVQQLWAITPKALTVSLAEGLTISKAYDGNTSVQASDVEYGLEISGLQAGESAAVSGTWAYASANAGAEITVNVTAIAIDYTGTAKADNYSYDPQDLATIGAISVKAVNVSPTARAITYGDTLADSTLSGIATVSTDSTAIIEGAFSWEDETLAPQVADSSISKYTWIFTPDSANYATQTGTITLVVAAKPITLTANAQEITYGTEISKTVSDVTDTNLALVGADALTAITLTASSDQVSAVGKTITPSAASIQNNGAEVTANYNITYATGDLTINNATIISSTVIGYSGVYDGAPHSISITGYTAVNAQDITVSYKTGDGAYTTENPSFTDQGNYTVDYKISAPNHADVLGSAVVDIAKKPLENSMLCVTDDGFIYNATAQEAAYTVADGDLLTTADYSVAFTNHTKAGTATLTITATDAGNYSGSASGTYTITAKTITAAWLETAAVYDGTAQAPQVVLIGTVDEDDISGICSGGTDAGSYLSRVTLSGEAAENYTLTNPSASYTIAKAAVTFTLASDGSVTATEAITGAAQPFVDFTVAYLASNGTSSSDIPTGSGSYAVNVEITNPNYRMAGLSTSAGSIGTYKVGAKSYTATFGDTIITSLKGAQVVVPSDSDSETQRFAGWYAQNITYKVGDVFTQPNKNITFIACYVDTYTINGVVVQEESGGTELPLEYATVTLMAGSNQIAQTTTQADGSYCFVGVQTGVYNIVVSYDGVTRTAIATIDGENITIDTINMPAGKTNSVVEVTAGSPDVVIGGLDTLFDTPASGESTANDYTSADCDIVAQRGSVALTLSVEEVTAVKTVDEIEAAADAVGLYLDIDITKTVTALNSNPVNSEVTETSDLLQIIIPLPAALQAKKNYTVYRMHGDEMHTITTKPNQWGEYIVISADKSEITLYVKYFSTYAIGYKEYSSSSSSSTSSSASDSVLESAVPTSPATGQSGVCYWILAWFTACFYFEMQVQ